MAMFIAAVAGLAVGVFAGSLLGIRIGRYRDAKDAVNTTIIVQCDGHELARSMATHLPSEIRRLGLN